jgi:uncharacterized membrane protein YhiD involved in acid resistance
VNRPDVETLTKGGAAKPTVYVGVVLVLLLVCTSLPLDLAHTALAQTLPLEQPPSRAVDELGSNLPEQIASLRHVALRLPFAAALSAVLAYRPRRRGTPARQLTVIQTQIILAIVGAIVMLVVGASLARAFGIVGAAGLIRYRAKIDDPKDAGVMLCTLAIGLASGVGLYLPAVFATGFVLAVLWILESLEPEPYVFFEMTVAAKETPELKAAIERILRGQRLSYELRTAAPEGISYDVRVPLRKDPETISTALERLDPKASIEVKWEKKKEK